MGIVENYRRQADRHLNERGPAAPAAPAMPRAWRLRDHPPVIAAAGLAVMILAAVAYWMPGIIMTGSVSEVRSMCGTGVGLLAQAGSQATASGCARAENWTAGAAVAAIAGAGMIIAAAFLARGDRRP